MERAIGCPEPSKLGSYQQKLESYQLSAQNVVDFRQALVDDALDTYYKAAVSFTEAISSIGKGYQSWAVIKLYYATFYCLKVFFATRDVGIVKTASSIYSLRISEGASVTKRSGKNVRGDHKTAFYIFKSDFGDGQMMLSNTIDGSSVFEWMMAAREDVNYRHPTFYEPDIDFFEPSLATSSGMLQWLNNYIRDQSGLYMFQEEHCCIATPLHLLSTLKRDLSSRCGVVERLGEAQQESLLKMLSEAKLDSSILRDLFFG